MYAVYISKVQTFSTRFNLVWSRRDFQAEVWSVFCKIVLLNLGQDSEAGFGHDFKSRYSCLVEILKLVLCD